MEKPKFSSEEDRMEYERRNEEAPKTKKKGKKK